MSTWKFGLLMASNGLLAGLALVLSCGNHTSESVASVATDAAPNACDCPAPVPFESRLREVKVTEMLASTDEYHTVEASCGTLDLPFGTRAKAIGGHCHGPVLQSNLPLVQVGTFLQFPDGSGFQHCTWRNPERLANIPLTAAVICVLPEGLPPDYYFLDAGVR